MKRIFIIIIILLNINCFASLNKSIEFTSINGSSFQIQQNELFILYSVLNEGIRNENISPQINHHTEILIKRYLQTIFFYKRSTDNIIIKKSEPDLLKYLSNHKSEIDYLTIDINYKKLDSPENIYMPFVSILTIGIIPFKNKFEIYVKSVFNDSKNKTNKHYSNSIGWTEHYGLSLLPFYKYFQYSSIHFHNGEFSSINSLITKEFINESLHLITMEHEN